MNNSFPNHTEQAYEKLKMLLRTASTRYNSIALIADYLLANGVLVSTTPIKKHDYRVQTINAESIGSSNLPEEHVREMLISSVMKEIEEKVVRKVKITNDNGVYKMKFPIIISNEVEREEET